MLRVSCNRIRFPWPRVQQGSPRPCGFRVARVWGDHSLVPSAPGSIIASRNIFKRLDADLEVVAVEPQSGTDSEVVA